MRKVCWVLSLLLTPWSFLIANELFDCPEVEVTVEDEELKIEGLLAPIEIVKIFNASYNLVYQCNGNCPDEIEIEDLSKGDYYIDIQSYTQNWRFICDLQKSLTIDGDVVPSCEAIKIAVNEDELSISGLNASNKIIKIFDVFYNVIDICFSNCPKTKTIPNLLAGIYYIDIQLYTADWQFICGVQEDVTIDLEEEPCDNSACLGNISLTTQAEVDEFCGCAVIEGNLKIGNHLTQNITSLSNLQSVEQVNGSITILNTKLQNLVGLGNLGKIGKELIIEENPNLKNVQGLNNLVEISQGFRLKENATIRDLKGLDRWTKTKSIDFQQNEQLRGIEKLSQLNNLSSLTISRNNQLKKLPDLIVDSLSGLTIENNEQLENLDFLSPIAYIDGIVRIKNNRGLVDCCGLTHLIDNDLFFGENNAHFIIENNPFSCLSTTNILNTCLSSAPTCDDIQVNVTNEKISITRLTPPNEIIKIFDEQYNILFNCFGNCESEVTMNNLTAGIYRVGVNFYNADWVPICETIISVEIAGNDITIPSNDRNDSYKIAPPSDILIAPNPAKGVTYLDLKNLKEKQIQLQLLNQFGQKVWAKFIEKTNALPMAIDLSTFQNGLYFLQIQAKGNAIQTKKLIVSNLY